MSSTEILGCDVGGVLITRPPPGIRVPEDVSEWTEVNGAIEAVAALAQQRFRPENVYLVSKCREVTEQKIHRWLRDNRFWERTGIPPEHIFFCRQRPGKAPICEELELTHFVDDRLEVLSYLECVNARFLFQGRPEENAQFSDVLKHVRQVDSWMELRKELLP